MAATAPSYDFDTIEDLRRTYSSAGTSGERFYIGPHLITLPKGLLTRIEEVAQDESLREENENPPTRDEIEMAKRLVSSSLGPDLPNPEISVYHGELDLTWKKDDKLVRLIVYPNKRPPRLYSHVKSEPVAQRGRSVEARSAKDVREKLDWLNS